MSIEMTVPARSDRSTQTEGNPSSALLPVHKQMFPGLARFFFPVAILFALAARTAGSQEVSIPPSAESPPPKTGRAPEWIHLFNDRDLFGWQPVTEANWKAVDGTIHVDSGEPGLLRTTSQFSDFELELEFQADRETNSGVFVLTSPKPKHPAEDCYEINLIRPERHEYATGSLVARVAGTADAHPDGTSWHRLRIVSDAGRLQTWVNDKPVVDYRDPTPLGRGYIALQYNGGRVAFRNIRLRPLGLKELLPIQTPGNTGPLEAWETAQVHPALLGWDSADGCLQLRGGPGQLETRETLADFVLQTRCRTDARNTNSGVLFRCIPGDRMMGYEIQIDNRSLEEDSDRPFEAGTGAVFRRTVVPQLLAKDLEWFTLTAAVCGPHVSVWVNGRQVTDWTDRREPNVNPRRGLRLEAGTLMLQAHDSKTAISVQSFQVQELRTRQTAGRR